MGWLGVKGIEFHPWGPKFKVHKWHSLWSTLEYWPNILYIPRLPSLSGDTCEQLIGWKIIWLKIIGIEIYIIYNKFIIIDVINLKIMFPNYLVNL